MRESRLKERGESKRETAVKVQPGAQGIDVAIQQHQHQLASAQSGCRKAAIPVVVMMQMLSWGGNAPFPLLSRRAPSQGGL